MDYRWVAVDFGGREVLRRVAADVPGPEHGQVRIEVRASGMNPADAKHIASGQDRSLLPLTIGFEVSGVVSAAGGGTDLAAGVAAALDTVGSGEAGDVSLALVPSVLCWRTPAIRR
jgi:NADPH:quinone reductase